MPNEKMEILRKPEINNMIAETCTGARVDALTNTILNDPRFLH